MPIDKDDTLKKALTKKVQTELTEEYRTKVAMQREADRASQMDKIIKSRTHIDPESGKEVDNWEFVINKANRMVDDAAMSYNDWRASMSSLIALFTNLNLALAHTKDELLNYVGTTILDGGVTNITTYITGTPTKIPGLLALYDSVKEKISGEPEVTLPDLQYLVEYSDDNKLKIQSLTRFEGDDLGDAINHTFKAGVHKWLDDRNYKPSQAEPGKWVKKDTGAVLTKDQFNALKDDPNTGLGAVLSNHYDLNLEERPAPRM